MARGREGKPKGMMEFVLHSYRQRRPVLLTSERFPLTF
jgi:hypothetical protein